MIVNAKGHTISIFQKKRDLAKSDTYPTLLQTLSFSKVTTVSSDVAVSFCISMCRLTPVNIIKRRDTSNCSASTASSEKCQYVMVSWSVYDCVAAYTCERNSI